MKNSVSENLGSGRGIVEDKSQQFFHTLESILSNIGQEGEKGKDIISKNFEQKLVQKEFSSRAAAQIAIKGYIEQLWNQTQNLGVLNFSEKFNTLEKHDTTSGVENSLREISDIFFGLFEPMLEKKENGKYEFNFSEENVETALSLVGRNIDQILHDQGANPGDRDIVESLLLQQLHANIAQAPLMLKANLEKKGFPSSYPKGKINSRNPIFVTLEALSVATVFSLATYGYHGFASTYIEKWALESPDLINSIWFKLEQNGLLHGTATWGGGALMGTAITGSLVWAMERFRKKRIQRADEAVNNPNNNKVSSLKKLGWFFKDTGPLIPLIAGSLGLLSVELLGILSKDVKGYYTAFHAHQTSRKVDNILNIDNPYSPTGQIKDTYIVQQQEVQQLVAKFLSAELNRGNAGGIGPAYISKAYLQLGPAVLDDTGLKDPKLRAIVVKYDEMISQQGTTLHERFPSLPGKIEVMRLLLERDTNNLGKKGHGFTQIAEQRQNAEPLELEKQKFEYLQAVEEYLYNIKKMNTTADVRFQIYQEFIRKIAEASDLKYKSTTAFNIDINLAAPDLSYLIKELETPIPSLEGKTPLEYWEVLNSLVGKDGGITEEERDHLVMFLAARVLLGELLMLSFLFIDLIKVVGLHSKPENRVDVIKKELYEHYGKLVLAVHELFSGESWESIFPNHGGITLEEADILVRELLVSIDPEVEKFLHIAGFSEQSSSRGKKILRGFLGFIKTIITGDSITREEKELQVIDTVFQKLYKKSGVDEQYLRFLTEKILPNASIFEGDKNEGIIPEYNSLIQEVQISTQQLRELTRETIKEETDQQSEMIEELLKDIKGWMANKRSGLAKIRNDVDYYLAGSTTGGIAELAAELFEDIKAFVEYFDGIQSFSIVTVQAVKIHKESIEKKYERILHRKQTSKRNY